MLPGPPLVLPPGPARAPLPPSPVCPPASCAWCSTSATGGRSRASQQGRGPCRVAFCIKHSTCQPLSQTTPTLAKLTALRMLPQPLHYACAHSLLQHKVRNPFTAHCAYSQLHPSLCMRSALLFPPPRLPPFAYFTRRHPASAVPYRVVVGVPQADGVREQAPAELERHPLYITNRPHRTTDHRDGRRSSSPLCGRWGCYGGSAGSNSHRREKQEVTCCCCCCCCPFQERAAEPRGARVPVRLRSLLSCALGDRCFPALSSLGAALGSLRLLGYGGQPLSAGV